VIERVRSVTDKPIKYVVLVAYHAVRRARRLGLSRQAVIGSAGNLSAGRGARQQDWDSEYGRFSAAVPGWRQSIPG